ncbi:MAG: hypothetical protein ACP5TL_00620 [Candidatus Micrarchaeia archaeon]
MVIKSTRLEDDKINEIIEKRGSKEMEHIVPKPFPFFNGTLEVRVYLDDVVPFIQVGSRRGDNFIFVLDGKLNIKKSLRMEFGGFMASYDNENDPIFKAAKEEAKRIVYSQNYFEKESLIKRMRLEAINDVGLILRKERKDSD